MNSGRDRESVKDVRGNGVVASHVSSRKGKGNRRTDMRFGREGSGDGEGGELGGGRESRRSPEENSRGNLGRTPSDEREGGESGRGVRGAEEERKLGGGGDVSFLCVVKKQIRWSNKIYKTELTKTR